MSKVGNCEASIDVLAVFELSTDLVSASNYLKIVKAIIFNYFVIDRNTLEAIYKAIR
jgi:hypothetical protein